MNCESMYCDTVGEELDRCSFCDKHYCAKHIREAIFVRYCGACGDRLVALALLKAAKIILRENQ